MPGILVGQCPTTYSGEIKNESNSSPCGFYTVKVYINCSSSFNAALGSVDGNFSNNIRIRSMTPNISGVNCSWTNDRFFELDLQNANIQNNTYLAEINYTLLEGSSGSVQTTQTQVAVTIGGTPVQCNPGGNEAALSLSSSAYILRGAVLIPSQFSCSANSTDHGLPDRVVTSEMNYSPNYEICESVTPSDGSYECLYFRNGCEYKVCVEKSDDDYCGIDEFDIDQILDYYLGSDCIDYTWQYFAADADNNGTIASNDMLQLNRYLLSLSFNIPKPWKYINFEAYDDASSNFDCNTFNVGVIDNCAEISLGSSPTIEDWYGFPTGDVNYSCTTCDFAPLISRTEINKISEVQLYATLSNSSQIEYSFDYPKSVNVWSLELDIHNTSAIPHQVSLKGIPDEDVVWSFNEKTGSLGIIYVNYDRVERTHFDILVRFTNTLSKDMTGSVTEGIDRIHNVVIHSKDDYGKFNNDIITIDRTNLLYPNPSKGWIYFRKALSDDHWIQIYELNGKEVFSGRLLDNYALNVSTFSNGVYLMRLSSSTENRTLKFSIF